MTDQPPQQPPAQPTVDPTTGLLADHRQPEGTPTLPHQPVEQTEPTPPGLIPPGGTVDVMATLPPQKPPEGSEPDTIPDSTTQAFHDQNGPRPKPQLWMKLGDRRFPVRTPLPTDLVLQLIAMAADIQSASDDRKLHAFSTMYNVFKRALTDEGVAMYEEWSLTAVFSIEEFANAVTQVANASAGGDESGKA